MTSLELELKKIGFSDKEAKVYLALLELGEAPVQKIGQKAKVNRATTYVILESLKKRGLVTTVEKGKKVNFAAENPTTLLKIFKAQEEELEDKEKEFRTALPEIEALFNLATNKPKVRYFEGREGIKAYRDDIFASGDKEILEVYSRDEVLGIYTKKEDDEFFDRREKEGVRVKVIYTSQDGPYTKFLSEGTRRFVPKDKFPFSSDISIYGAHVAFTTLRGQHITVIIESQEVSDTMRLLFELAWQGAEKYSK